jgi:hypothetical protein
VWHFAHGWLVFCAIAGLAIVCPEPSMIIAAAINSTVAVSAAPVTTARIVLGFCMVDLLIIAPIHPTFPR